MLRLSNTLSSRVTLWSAACLAASVIIGSGAAAAATGQAGKAIFVAPPVTVEHGATRVLNQGDAIATGDTVVTGAKARAQLLMADGARIALRSGTRYRIDEFALPAGVNAPTAATAVAADGRSFATLLKGGLRTTSGAIGKRDPSAYELRTPVGTLGIRGTDYAAVLCRADCSDVADAPGNIRDGLYLSVFGGSIVFRLGAEEFVLTFNQHLFIPLAGGRPEPLPEAPAWVLGDGAGALTAGRGAKARNQGTDKLTDFNNRRSPDAAAGAGTSQPGNPGDGTSGKIDQPVTGTDGQGQPVDLTPAGVPKPRNIDMTYAIPQLTQFTRVQGVTVNAAPEFASNGAGTLTALTVPLPSAGAPVNANLDIGTATNADFGSNSATGLRWGRWTGGALTVNVGGQPTTQALAQQSLHWIYADNVNAPVMPRTGSSTFTLIGGTNPTDNQGHVGTLGSAAFAADFTNQRVTSSLSLTINGTLWTADGTGSIGAQAGLAAHQFQGAYQTVTIGAAGLAGSGNFSGFFTAPGGTQAGAPGGAGMTFALGDDQGLIITGVAAFRGP